MIARRDCRAPLLCALCLSGCTQPSSGTDLFYAWDDRNVLCSDPIDDLEGVTRNWTTEEGRFRDASKRDMVTLVHAHQPDVTVSRDALERVFGWADQYGLDYVRFDELVPGKPRPGLAFAFDDDDVAGWLSVRDILMAHHARVTFFITRWDQMDDTKRAGIATLAADGHDIEPHTVDHPHALDYIAANGLDAYIANEVQPSLQVLAAAGYPTTSFAYPFGDHDDAIDRAVLAIPGIARVRTTPGECPGEDTPAATGED